MVAVRVDESERDAAIHFGMHQHRAGVGSVQHMLKELVRQWINALEEVAMLQWHSELTMKEEEHDIGDVNIGQPLTIAPHLSTIALCRCRADLTASPT